jgi:hypothetical protein
MTHSIRTRFAPSPTGYIHVGNVRSALFPWIIARQNGGKFILRIEDTDQARYVEGATEMVLEAIILILLSLFLSLILFDAKRIKKQWDRLPPLRTTTPTLFLGGCGTPFGRPHAR